MSENEKKKRLEYKRMRKKWMIIQLIAISLVFVIALGAFAVYQQMNKTYYIQYTENGGVSYKVRLQDNDFYHEEWLDSGHAYISSLISTIDATMKYDLAMDTDGVDFEYSYYIDAKLVVKNKQTGESIYDPVYQIAPEKTVSIDNGRGVHIAEKVVINYVEYNEIATSFINKYSLKNISTSMLTVTMHVNILSNCQDFEGSNSNNYTVSLNVPLAEQTVSMYTSASAPASESKVLACSGAVSQDLFKTVALLAAAFDAVLACAFVAFIYITRNEDINYAIQVKRILSSYRSYIQQIDGKFDSCGYQLVKIKTFKEMLAIRDTIQSPVLMSENEDQTMTEFLIPTNTKILYAFDIKVKNYDEIYGNNIPVAPSDTIDAEPEASAADSYVAVTEQKDEPVSAENTFKDEAEVVAEAEPTVATEPEVEIEAEPETEVEIEVEPEAVVEDEVKEAEVEEDAASRVAEFEELIIIDADSVEESDTDEDVDKDSDLNIGCSRSFLANLIQSDRGTKRFYSELKNYIMSFKGVKSRFSWRVETFKQRKNQLFKLKIRGKALNLYCALDPEEYPKNRYYQERAESKVYSLVPMMVKVRSQRGLKRAYELVDAVMAKFGLAAIADAQAVDYVTAHPYETTRALVDRGLIRLLSESVDKYDAKDSAALAEEEKIEMLAGQLAEENIIIDTAATVEAGIDAEAIKAAIDAPDLVLEQIDFDESTDEEEELEGEAEENGIEVVGVVWPERARRNKIYRYDPNGETYNAGDVVFVPTRDAAKNRNIVRKAVVAHGNHKISEENLVHPLKKIIGIVIHDEITAK